MQTSNVEIFKTDVSSELIGEIILSKLKNNFPAYKVNFDLDDCDKILRVESKNGNIEVNKILVLVEENRVMIELITE